MYTPLKVASVLLLVAVGTSTVYSQANWIFGDGGTFSDETLDLETAASGEHYQCGYFNQSAQFSPFAISSNGLSDIFICKRNTAGAVNWVMSAGGMLPDRANAIATAADGSCVVTGYYTGSANFSGTTLTSQGNSQDVFVAKYNINGGLIWAVTLGGNDTETGFGVDINSAGEAVVTGQFKGTASFGSTNLTSAWNADDAEFSFDIFVCKLSSAGTVLWAKSGSAPLDDRTTDVEFDALGDIYLTGQFSENITFTNTYNNLVENVGFVMKMNASGTDLWLKRMTANYIICEDLEIASNSDVVISGSFSGQFVFLDAGMAAIEADYDYNFFITRLTSAADFVWLSHDGSDNYMAGYRVCEDNLGNFYCTGVFECVMTEYNAALGGYFWYSAGYTDVYVTKFDAIGIRIWMRQLGGIGMEQCQSIDAQNNNQPVVAGGFENWLNMTVNSTFAYNVYSDANTGMDAYSQQTLCGNPNAGLFAGIQSSGNRDSFIAKPYSSAAADFNFIDHMGADDCPGEEPELCLEYCIDSLILCVNPGQGIPIDIFTQTGQSMIIGPYYNITYGGTGSCSLNSWAGGGYYVPDLLVYGTGTYWVTIESVGSCLPPQTDSIYVELNYYPTEVEIWDNLNMLQECNPILGFPETDEPGMCEELNLCSPLVNLFVAEEQSGITYSFINGTDTIYATDVEVSEDSYWILNAESADGCVVQDQVTVNFQDNGPSEDYIGYLQLMMNGLPYNNDTIWLCPGDPVMLEFLDFFTNENYLPGEGAYWYGINCTPNDTLTMNYFSNMFNCNPGWNTVQAWFSDPNSDCPIVQEQLSFYVEIYDEAEMDQILEIPTGFCSGDLVTYTASGADTYIWYYGGQVISTADQITTNLPGNYSLNVSVTTPNGCTIEGSAGFIYPLPANPQITTDPGDGVVCPNDSVQILAPPAASYLWLGPEGSIVSESQTFFTNIPGDYHVVITDANGCVSESGFVNIELYTTPFLVATPYDYFCTPDPITITIQTNDESAIAWLPPLSGTALEQVITVPGVYSVTVALCGISEVLSIEIFDSPVDAAITTQGPQYFCAGDTITASAVNGMTAYNWLPDGQATQSIVITQPGSYTVTAIDQEGCTGTSQILDISFYDMPEPIVANVQHCTGTPVTLAAAGDFDIQWLNGNLNWIGQGNTLTTPPIAIDTTFYVLATTGNCVSDTIAVPATVYEGIDFDFDVEGICLNEVAHFTMQTGSAVNPQWTLGDGTNASGIAVAHYYNSAGTYLVTLQATSAFGCAETKSDSVTVFSIPQSIYAVSDTIACSPLEVMFSNESESFTTSVWHFDDGTTSNQLSPNHAFMNVDCVPAVFNTWLAVFNIYGCSDTSYQALTVLPNPQALFELSDTVSCYYPAVATTINSTYCADTYHWALGSSNAGTAVNTTIQIPTVGVHQISLAAANSFGCVDTTSATFEVFPLPMMSVDASAQNACPGNAIELSNNSLGAVGYTWVFSGEPFFDEENLSITYYQPGLYDAMLIANTGAGCVDTLFYEDWIEIYTPPVASFDIAPPVASMYTPEFVFTNTCTTSIAQWWTVDNTHAYITPYVVYHHIGLGALPVELVVMDNHQCLDTALKYAYIDVPFTIYVPNSITLNNDGLNELFVPVMTGTERLVSYSLQIFDRWGDVIFTTNTTGEGWSGDNHSGAHYVQNDVYVWQVKYKLNIEAEAQVLNGTITIVR
ncbi:MAG: PKD domain-containing protein [Flavobacteriales bacterium]